MEGAGGGVALLSEHRSARTRKGRSKWEKCKECKDGSKYQTINRATNLRQDKNSAAVR